jgi:hypothetical protein
MARLGVTRNKKGSRVKDLSVLKTTTPPPFSLGATNLFEKHHQREQQESG